MCVCVLYMYVLDSLCVFYFCSSFVLSLPFYLTVLTVCRPLSPSFNLAAQPHPKATPPQEPEDFVVPLSPHGTGSNVAAEAGEKELGDDLELVPMDEDVDLTDEEVVEEALVLVEPEDKMDASLDSVSSGDLEEHVEDEKDALEETADKLEEPAPEEQLGEASMEDAGPVDESFEISVDDSEEGKDKAEPSNEVPIEPIYQPDAEELLYEGDVDGEQSKEGEAPTEKKDEEPEAAGFVVDIHGPITDDFSKEQEGINRPLGVGVKPKAAGAASKPAAKSGSPPRKASGEVSRKQSQDGGSAESPRFVPSLP